MLCCVQGPVRISGYGCGASHAVCGEREGAAGERGGSVSVVRPKTACCCCCGCCWLVVVAVDGWWKGEVVAAGDAIVACRGDVAGIRPLGVSYWWAAAAAVERSPVAQRAPMTETAAVSNQTAL